MSLKDRLLASNAPAWISEQKGDMLIGEVVNRSTRTTEYGAYEIITVLPEEKPTVKGSTTFDVLIDGKKIPYVSGPLAWHAMGSVAIRKVDEENPAIGDGIAILDDGEKVAQQGAGKGKKYDVVQVVVERRVGSHVQPPAARSFESFTPDVDDDEVEDDEEPF